jgi:hypothetical protein
MKPLAPVGHFRDAGQLEIQVPRQGKLPESPQRIKTLAVALDQSARAERWWWLPFLCTAGNEA